MKLFLTSAGIAPGITDDFLKLLEKKPKDCRLIFVPTAGDPENDKWFIKKDKERLAEIGFAIDEVDLKNNNKNSLAEILENADVVFVAGGNTFYLLDWVRISGFDEAVKEFVERGGIYVGSSAGSMIVGQNIETAGWKYADKNSVDLNDLTAMNFVPFAITPHYNNEVAPTIKEAAMKVKYPVVALTDAQAVMVDGDKTKIIGSGEKIVFNNSIGL